MRNKRPPLPTHSEVLIYLGGLPHSIVCTQQAGEYLMEIAHVVAFGHGSVQDESPCSWSGCCAAKLVIDDQTPVGA